MNDDSSQAGMGKSARRDSLNKAAAGVAGMSVAGSLSVARSAHAQGSDVIKIALIGCGGRGTGAAVNALSNKANPNVRLVAMADAFRSRVDNSFRAIQERFKDRVDVPEERKFVDLDGYQKAITCEVDMVLLCTPPGFRPMQFEAAVKAGRHVFMEKPVAVDAPGIRRIMAANEEAKKKGLLVAVGHHLRHEVKHREVIRRVHDGIIGQIKYMRAYFNSGGVWFRARQPDQTEMQFQVANWYYFNWLCGDHIVEQHVHDLDVMNWIKNDHPIKANGMGGRQVRTPKWAVARGMGPGDVGEIFDHHAVEFEYAGGTKMYSFCRHIPGCWNAFSEYAHGTKGYADIEGHGRGEIHLNGRDQPLHWDRGPDGHQVEHDDLFAALLAGQPYNEADWAADSSMTAIMGRMATYSGKQVDWETAINSTLDFAPKQYSWDAEAPVKPNADGFYDCAMPGVTQAW